MRKVIVWKPVSLDGFFEGPGGDLSWHRVDDELHQHFKKVDYSRSLDRAEWNTTVVPEVVPENPEEMAHHGFRRCGGGPDHG